MDPAGDEARAYQVNLLRASRGRGHGHFEAKTITNWQEWVQDHRIYLQRSSGELE
jgi:hypothetical protein